MDLEKLAQELIECAAEGGRVILNDDQLAQYAAALKLGHKAIEACRVVDKYRQDKLSRHLWGFPADDELQQGRKDADQALDAVLVSAA